MKNYKICIELFLIPAILPFLKKLFNKNEQFKKKKP